MADFESKELYMYMYMIYTYTPYNNNKAFYYKLKNMYLIQYYPGIRLIVIRVGCFVMQYTYTLYPHLSLGNFGESA
jgi:hypothetical protein